MDLLNEKKSKMRDLETNKRKILVLLVICIVLIILTLILIAFAKKSNSKAPGYSIEIDGVAIALTDNFILNHTDQKKYINVKLFSDAIQYPYYNGEYMKFNEDKTNCYVNNKNQIIGFKVGTNEIYKTYKIQNDAIQKADFEYYHLDNNIIAYNSYIYICLEDLPNAFGLVVKDDIATNKTQIYSQIYLIEAYEKNLIESYGYTGVSKEYDNLKVLSKGIIIANKNNMYGLLNENYDEITGSKYSSITYSELLNEFIVCSNKKYGVLDITGAQKIKVSYDSIQVIYDGKNILYQVEQDDKYGILGEKGAQLVNTMYDSIGIKDATNGVINIVSVEDIGDMLIVCDNGLFGLINLEDGKIEMECSVKSIYLKTEANGEKAPYAKIILGNGETRDILLKTYLDFLNTQQVVIE